MIILSAVIGFVCGCLAVRRKPVMTARVFEFIRSVQGQLLRTEEFELENRRVWEASEWLVTTEKGKALLGCLARDNAMLVSKPPKSAETLAFDAGRASVITQIVMWGLRKAAPERKDDNG